MAERGPYLADAGLQGARAAFKALWWTATGASARRATRPGTGEEAVRFESDTQRTPRATLREAWLEAFLKDVRDVRAGLYPPSEPMFSDPVEAFRAVDDFLKDARDVDARRRRGDATEAREHEGSDAYPVYYRQNFHFQSGGWFTEASARRYEPQVEALFSGAAGAMRRRALSLLARAWRTRDQRDATIVDVACGAGAFLRDLGTAFPRARLFGLDLSPAYVREARRRGGVPVVQASAERLPFADASLDAASCVYLFHELPPRVRRVVAGEIARVLKPGGLLAFADSVRSTDRPEFARMLEAFPAYFHEPYYESWRNEDLEGLFAAAGLRLVDTDLAFFTKAWLFEKAQNSAS